VRIKHRSAQSCGAGFASLLTVFGSDSVKASFPQKLGSHKPAGWRCQAVWLCKPASGRSLQELPSFKSRTDS